MAPKSRRERVGEHLLFLSLASPHLEGGESSHQSNGSIAKFIEHVPGCLRTSHGESVPFGWRFLMARSRLCVYEVGISVPSLRAR